MNFLSGFQEQSLNDAARGLAADMMLVLCSLVPQAFLCLQEGVGWCDLQFPLQLLVTGDRTDRGLCVTDPCAVLQACSPRSLVWKRAFCRGQHSL